jgi:hypothetical protein
MGAQPRLEKKDKLRYRKGSTSELRWCRVCTHFVPDYVVKGIPLGRLLVEPRCGVMGLHESIRYRVRLDHTCEAYEPSREELERLARIRARFRKD